MTDCYLYLYVYELNLHYHGYSVKILNLGACLYARKYVQLFAFELAGRGLQAKRQTSRLKQPFENCFGSKNKFVTTLDGKLAPPSNLCRPTQTQGALCYVNMHEMHTYRTVLACPFRHWWSGRSILDEGNHRRRRSSQRRKLFGLF
jgi:hypothetical protein